MQPSKILVPIDYSSLSRHALEAAVRLAQATGASITLLHVHEGPDDVPIDLEWEPSLTADDRNMKEALERAVERWAASTGLPADRVKCSCVEGPAAVMIAEASKDHTLVFMATNGRAGLRRLVIGSVTERVVRTAACSVLVYRPPK